MTLSDVIAGKRLNKEGSSQKSPKSSFSESSLCSIEFVPFTTISPRYSSLSCEMSFVILSSRPPEKRCSSTEESKLSALLSLSDSRSIE